MAIQVTNSGGLPNTVSGTGTTQKLFGPQINVPGSSRLDGAQFIVRASGNVTTGTPSAVLLSLVATYPTLASGAAQYPVANITNAVGNTTGGANVALYNANNNFVLGQFVNVTSVASALNGLVGPLIVANSTAFAGQVAGANVANTAAITLTNSAAATIQPINLYNGVAAVSILASNTVPFMAELRCMGDSGSGTVVCYGTDQIANVNLATAGPNVLNIYSGTGVCTPVPGVNFKNEPPLILQISETFGSSNANNTATLKSFFLES